MTAGGPGRGQAFCPATDLEAQLRAEAAELKGEWNLVTIAWNMKRMFALSQV